MEKRKSLRERLMEVLEDDEGEGTGEPEEDTIILRGPSARRLLGLLDDPSSGTGSGDGKGSGEGDGKGEPDPEPSPQRTQSRYFGDKK